MPVVQALKHACLSAAPAQPRGLQGPTQCYYRGPGMLHHMYWNDESLPGAGERLRNCLGQAGKCVSLPRPQAHSPTQSGACIAPSEIRTVCKAAAQIRGLHLTCVQSLVEIAC